jgi:hypothetical protein
VNVEHTIMRRIIIFRFACGVWPADAEAGERLLDGVHATQSQPTLTEWGERSDR